MVRRHYLACDLGAESGRLMLGTLADGRLALEELHRFANTPIRDGESLRWDLPRLFGELQAGLVKAAARKMPITSISTDSWGVDYVLLDERGDLMEPAFHYRDARTARGVKRILERVGWETIFGQTGIQFMPLNTLFQLGAEPPERLARASRLLTIGDAFNYWLSGQAVVEESNASTTQLYDPRARQWATELLIAADIPPRLLPQIVPSGTRLGPLKAELARELGMPAMEVVAACTHDTAAAVAGVPAAANAGPWAYISSGTWSLLGVETGEPVITPASREANFTNEVGFGGSIRLLKNISGMWLVQECRRRWKGEGTGYEYDHLTELAAAATPFRSLINPMDARFLAPDDMTAAIADYCRETQQPAPATPGEFVRCILESLALLYRRTLQQVDSLVGRRSERVHIVGGGSRNKLLNQLAADALQIPVVTGPTEATALGNIIVQAIAMGDLPGLSAAREVICASIETQTVLPEAGGHWAAHFERFDRLS
jgi:rhamnulokinase